jgi:hypothetical protein
MHVSYLADGAKKYHYVTIVIAEMVWKVHHAGIGWLAAQVQLGL